jgi:hypothetical protein
LNLLLTWLSAHSSRWQAQAASSSFQPEPELVSQSHGLRARSTPNSKEAISLSSKLEP